MFKHALTVTALVAALGVWSSAAFAENPVPAPRAGLRLGVGGGGAFGPSFVAAGGSLDWFVRPSFGVGVAVASTLPSLGDRLAVEDGYGFATLLARWRPATAGRLRAELIGGGGAARIDFGTPGSHLEYAPDAAFGAAVGMALGARLELAVEALTHLTFGERAAARAYPHQSGVVLLVLRVGG